MNEHGVSRQVKRYENLLISPVVQNFTVYKVKKCLRIRSFFNPKGRNLTEKSTNFHLLNWLSLEGLMNEHCVSAQVKRYENVAPSPVAKNFTANKVKNALRLGYFSGQKVKF